MASKNNKELITMKKLPACLFCLYMIFTSCEKQNDNTSFDISGLKGNTFVLKVDRLLFNTDVQFPSESLQEEDYLATDESIQYEVVFSSNGEEVYIEPGTIKGEIEISDQNSIQYKLVEGVFAGGRLIVWKIDESFEAEFTIYGSGVPIVSSERGELELAEE